MGLGLMSEFSKLSLATAIMALTPVSCHYMTSFNFGGKEARDVGLTCRQNHYQVYKFKNNQKLTIKARIRKLKLSDAISGKC